MIFKSYAKLNLFLAVLNKRSDNYHNIDTLFERITLCDKIILKNLPVNKIKIFSNSSEIPKDSSNLAYKAARLLKDSYKINQGISIRITKRIPVGAGLGGGSSNAAAVLLGLNKLWHLNLRQKQLLGLAKQIGADVPFFIYQLPFCRGTGRGDLIKPVTGLKRVKLWHLLLVPRINVSTPKVYKEWDKIKKAGLTQAPQDVKIIISAFKKRGFSGYLFNGLEAASIKLYPRIIRAKQKLNSLGLKLVLMSGSGPAVFAIVSSRQEALSLRRQLKENRFWRVFTVSTH